MSLYDYKRWKNFTKSDLICKYTGKENPNVVEFTKFMDMVQEMRGELGFPFYIASCYRDPTHPEEAKKVKPGQHSRAAIDIRVDPENYYKLLKKAIEKGFTGIGINCKGAYKNRFIHLDNREIPSVWSYA